MDIKSKLQIVTGGYSDLETRYHSLTESIARLTQAGCLNAVEFWREDKYLYLVFPMRGGQRKKMYIGCNALRIKEARQKLANYSARNELILGQEKIQEHLNRLEELTVEQLQLLSSSSLSARFALVEDAGDGLGDKHRSSSTPVCHQSVNNDIC